MTESKVIPNNICDTLNIARCSLVWKYNKAFYTACQNFWIISKVPDGIAQVFEQMSYMDVLHVSNYSGYLEYKFHMKKVDDILTRWPQIRSEFIKANPDIDPDELTNEIYPKWNKPMTQLVYWLNKIVVDAIDGFYNNCQ